MQNCPQFLGDYLSGSGIVIHISLFSSLQIYYCLSDFYYNRKIVNMNFCLNLYLLCGGRTVCNSHWSRLLNESDHCYYIYQMIRGSSKMIDFQSNEYILETGKCYIIDGSRIESVNTDHPFEKYWCHFLPESLVIDYLLKGIDAVSQVETPESSIAGNWSLINNIFFTPEVEISDAKRFVDYKSLYAIKSDAPLSSVAQFQSILIDVIGKATDKICLESSDYSSFYLKFRPVIQKMDSFFKESPSVAELAQVIGISKEHFSRLFKQHLGISPHEYMLKKKIELAKQLLLKTRMQVKEISYNCGFSEPYYFSRSFSKYTGLSPSDFRAHYKNLD